MIRGACLLALIALGVLFVLCIQKDGAAAIAFSFIGFPALAGALAIYGLQRLIVRRNGLQ